MAIATVGQAHCFKSGRPGSFTLIALRDISFDIITVREAGKALRRRTLGSFCKTRMQSLTFITVASFCQTTTPEIFVCTYPLCVWISPDPLFVVRLIRRCNCLNIKRHSQVRKVADSALLL